MKPRLPLLALVLVIAGAPAPAQDPLLAELHRMTPSSAPKAPRPVVGDVDGDGDPDLIDRGNGMPRVALNQYRGRLTFDDTAQFVGTCNCSRYEISLAELDGDGLPDAVVDGTPYFGDGTGSFVAGTSPVGPAPSTVRHGFEDVDGDGDTDIFFLFAESGQIEILTVENLGARSFVQIAAQTITEPTNPILEDLDGDGDLDLFFDNRAEYVRYFQDASGTFVRDITTTPYTGQSFGFTETALGDVDGDGDVDAVSIGYAEGIWIHSNDGSGDFVFEVLIASSARRGYLELVDLEADGDRDILAFNGPYDPNDPAAPALLLESIGGFAFDDVSHRLPANGAVGFAATAADFDSDGFEDLLLDLATEGTLRLLVNDGFGAFVDSSTHVPREVGLPTAMEVADLNGDGAPEVVADVYGNPLLWINDGAGAMTHASDRLPSSLGQAEDIAVGDVDADGDLDLLWPQYGQSRLLINDGHANFADETSSRLPRENASTRAVVLADLDGDGDLDAVLGNDASSLAGPSPPADEVWLNDGSGVFVSAGVLPTVGQTRALAVADVDRDEDLDVLAGIFGQNLLFLNDGSGSFVDATANLPTSTASTRDVEFGDLDGDGSMDAFFVNLGETSSPGCYDCIYSNLADEVVMNDGTGVFTALSTPRITGGVGFEAELADLDEDGDLDALVAQSIGTRINRPDPAVEILWNDGTGELRQATEPLVQQRLLGLGLGVGDLDGDDDLDVVANLRIFTNRTRSLAWRSLPRVGVPLVLDLSGPQNSPYVLAGALETTSRPTDLGILRIVPSSIVLLAHGLLGDYGHATQRFEIPNDPELAGRTLFWQALVGNVYRFTNLEPTRFH